MPAPKFFVIARVVGRDRAMALSSRQALRVVTKESMANFGSMGKWKERLVHLCGVSATEPHGDSYYWGEDLDGEPDTLWGLEGYTHPIGFFIDHISSDIFKREMALVDKDELLKHQQGLGSPDYDLHHYDKESGWLKRDDDPDRDCKTSYVAIHHFWATSEKNRTDVLGALSAFAADARNEQPRGVQSCLVLRE
ncbi:unnamed protein product [Clonostachys rosea]|uniref:Uncharacterized protein n=1 Tax=Bionectria ochroleuca TaxID=29856 RepID=A0ABY6U627_BIOOC|nr:unnamed protein product [Clonostachys rosea]